MSNYIKTVRNSVKHWYISAIIGVLLILLGIFSFITPLSTYITLSIFFSAVFMMSGILQIIFAVSNKDELDGWGWQLSAGILYTLLGFYLLIHPEVTMITLPFVVAFYVLFNSIYQIAYSIELKQLKMGNWWVLLIWGLLGVIVSFILMVNPLVAGLSIVYIISLAIIMSGISGLILSFHLNKVKRKMKKIPDEWKQKYQALKEEYDNFIR